MTSPPVPEPKPLRQTIAEQGEGSPLEYPTEDFGQNSFCKMFGLINKADIKVANTRYFLYPNIFVDLNSVRVKVKNHIIFNSQ